MRFSEFWMRNRTIIISALGLMVLLNFCGRMWAPKTETRPIPQSQITQLDNGSETQLKSYEELMYERSLKQPQSKNDGSFWQTVMTLAIIATLFYYGFTKGWLTRLMPKWVSFNTVFFRDRSTHRLLVRLSVANNTNDSQTFISPQLLFKRWTASRRFNIKSSVFPLTLTPGTRQEIVIDIDQFWEKIPDLKGFNRVGAMIQTSGGKTYKTFAWPKWIL
ncbi:hypothetical protein ACT3CD_10220 [Geofilum sp. OHC36d9]|uniref:hypothetical protein n=1 Tax=Geofilum sp. OHC36d9 TaxID=3458413 RepID=UPI004034E002